MRTLKWLGATGAVLALGGVGLYTTGGSADAAPVTIVAGSGSHASCTITGTVKLSVALVNDWSQAAHSGANADPNPNATIKAAMASIKDTTYNAGSVPVTTTSKSTAVCTDSLAKQGANETGIASATIDSTGTSTGENPATCSGLADGGASETLLKSVIKWKGTGTAKIAPSTVYSTTSQLNDEHGVGFLLTTDHSEPGSSFENGTGTTKAYIPTSVGFSLIAPPATYDNPDAHFNLGGGDIPNVCQPNVSAKFTAAAAEGGASDSVAIKLKKPKGLKGFTVGAPGAYTSTLTASVP